MKKGYRSNLSIVINAFYDAQISRKKYNSIIRNL